jgi:hypothetical protein
MENNMVCKHLTFCPCVNEMCVDKNNINSEACITELIINYNNLYQELQVCRQRVFELENQIDEMVDELHFID